ncbi:lysine--tRNA ligase [Candidatus Woesearchaeota archaeon]|nr:lysine--tRNA ligase [Candidatus Woesearchaeota archaeon]
MLILEIFRKPRQGYRVVSSRKKHGAFISQMITLPTIFIFFRLITSEMQHNTPAPETKHWADSMADEIIERAEQNPQLKEITQKVGYIVYDEKTPSGKIHIGSGRGWVIHDVIAKALRDKGAKGRFILSSDDIDPFDKMNKELPPEYAQYLGMPFREIPSPVPGYKSFADYYFKQCVEKFEEFGIVAEIESTGEQYDQGRFNPFIKIALDHADQIKAIYEKLHGKQSKGSEKLPFNPRCEKCGKIGTTVAYAWDPEREMLKYVCKEDFVPWAKGCGYEGEISPYNGNGKFPWKVEWAAKWPMKGVVCEFAGKDHFSKGGSREVACTISMDVFKFPPPYPSNGYDFGSAYEFFTIGGKKMSTSKGQGVGFVDATQFAPAQVLRYLLVKTRPHAVIDFDPYGTNDLILLYERYDKTERIYYGTETTDNARENFNQRRIYELSHIGKIRRNQPVQIPFTHASFIVQIAKDEASRLALLRKTEHISENIDYENLEQIRERLHFAERWVKEFAPEQFKFQLRDAVPTDITLTENERSALRDLGRKLHEKAWQEQELYEEIYVIARSHSVEPPQFFKAAYQVLINKERGPKLAGFLLVVKDDAVRLLESIS